MKKNNLILKNISFHEKEDVFKDERGFISFDINLYKYIDNIDWSKDIFYVRVLDETHPNLKINIKKIAVHLKITNQDGYYINKTKTDDNNRFCFQIFYIKNEKILFNRVYTDYTNNYFHEFNNNNKLILKTYSRQNNRETLNTFNQKQQFHSYNNLPAKHIKECLFNGETDFEHRSYFWNGMLHNEKNIAESVFSRSDDPSFDQYLSYYFYYGKLASSLKQLLDKDWQKAVRISRFL